jgi:hypothetical protein
MGSAFALFEPSFGIIVYPILGRLLGWKIRYFNRRAIASNVEHGISVPELDWPNREWPIFENVIVWHLPNMRPSLHDR